MSKKIFRPHLSTASDARAVRTRDALRAALLRLLEVKSLELVTIRDIAAEAGIGYTTFFRHHPTKESLLDDLAASQLRRLITLAMPMLSNQDAFAASKTLFKYVDEERALWSTLLTGGAADALRQEFLKACLEIAQSWPNPSTWPPADLTTQLVASGTVELLAWWLRQANPVSVGELAEIYEHLIVGPAQGRAKSNASPPLQK
ncbi:MAG: TetR/AcrR family transcriptional regulator [Cupriavidus sp.]|nr:MAG: TetR/AcrR family transcriptional regulator [Cupriavidus sp.]